MSLLDEKKIKIIDLSWIKWFRVFLLNKPKLYTELVDRKTYILISKSYLFMYTVCLWHTQCPTNRFDLLTLIFLSWEQNSAFYCLFLNWIELKLNEVVQSRNTVNLYLLVVRPPLILRLGNIFQNHTDKPIKPPFFSKWFYLYRATDEMIG